MFDIFAKRKDDFKNPRMKNKDIWHDIFLEMQAEGYVSCDTKFKTVKRAYTARIDHHSKTGNDAKKCAYYEELNGIFHGDDNIEPQAVFSSRNGLVKRGKEGSSESSTEWEDAECTASDDHDDAIKKRKPRKKAPSERSELVSLFKKILCHFEIPFKSRGRKGDLIDKLLSFIQERTCFSPSAQE